MKLITHSLDQMISSANVLGVPRVSPRRAVRALLPCAIAVGIISACSASAEEPTGLATPSPEPTAAPTVDEPTESAEDTESAEQLAALETLFEEYWAAVTDLWNDPELDPDVIRHVTTPGHSEMMLTYVHRELIANDARRDGEPVIGEIVTHIDGDEARVEGCVDQSDWKLLVGDTEVPVDFGGPRPYVLEAVPSDDGWLVNDELDEDEATIAC